MLYTLLSSIPSHIDLCPVSRLPAQTSFSEELDTFGFPLDDLRLASFDERLQRPSQKDRRELMEF
jgi:hypothetical protein